ncbi:MAG: hypothetical protein L3K24_11690 [Gammaproteobacteria bacterium]|nr:hypothetical protein [Gammaproteobacteria bacterium]
MDRVINISSWDGKERRVNSTEPDRCQRISDKISPSDGDWKEYIERIQWEQNTLFDYLKDIQRKKFLVINYAVGIFPFLVAAIITTYSYISKASGGSLSGVVIGLFIVILMAAGASNMVAIKYIAAFKANAILLIRQIICLRQALDTVNYCMFEGELPKNIDPLRNRDTKYWSVFGRHRKLPIGNSGYRRHYLDNYSESADKTVIVFIFIVSSLLLCAPTIFMIVNGHFVLMKGEYISVGFYEILLGVTLALALVCFRFFIKDFSEVLAIPLPSEDKEDSDDDVGDKPIKYTMSKSVIALGVGPILVVGVLFVAGFSQLNEGKRIVLTFMALIGVFCVYHAFYSVFIDSFNRIKKAAITKKT